MNDKKQISFSEYRNQFKSEEEFKKAFEKLSEEEVHALIAAEPSGITIKACFMTAWRKSKTEEKK